MRTIRNPRNKDVEQLAQKPDGAKYLCLAAQARLLRITRQLLSANCAREALFHGKS